MTVANLRSCLGALALFAVCLSAPVAASVELHPEDIDWSTIGTDVEFHLRFRNPDLVESQPVSGELWATQFGVFLPPEVPVGTFDIPPIPPESFFDVVIQIPLDQLPPSAEETVPGEGLLLQPDHCTPDDHWDGNVDIFWSGPGGGGQVVKHIGTIQVCPGGGNSYIHVITAACTTSISWTITGLCPGFSATLVNEDLTPAPNPLPVGWPGGHICISAAGSVAPGAVCCLNVNFFCGAQTATINLCATACICGPSAVEPTEWGSIKSLYR
jgi:hypothetical protein